MTCHGFVFVWLQHKKFQTIQENIILFSYFLFYLPAQLQTFKKHILAVLFRVDYKNNCLLHALMQRHWLFTFPPPPNWLSPSTPRGALYRFFIVAASLQVPAGHQIEIHNEFFMQIRSRRWRVKLLTVTFYFIVNYFYTMREFFLMHLQSWTKNYENCAIVCNTKCPVSEFKQSVTKAKLMYNYLKFHVIFIYNVYY